MFFILYFLDSSLLTATFHQGIKKKLRNTKFETLFFILNEYEQYLSLFLTILLSILP